MSTFYVQGITLRYWSVGEWDRVYRLLTAEYGLIDARLQGAVKITSKLAGHLEPFSQVKLLLARRRGPYRIAGVQLIQRFFTDDLLTNFYLAKLAAVTEQLLGGEQAQMAAWPLLNKAFQNLLAVDPMQQPQALAAILAELSAVAGYAIPQSKLNEVGNNLLATVEKHLANVLPYPVRLT